jgi:hypothetical protein
MVLREQGWKQHGKGGGEVMKRIPLTTFEMNKAGMNDEKVKEIILSRLQFERKELARRRFFKHIVALYDAAIESVEAQKESLAIEAENVTENNITMSEASQAQLKDGDRVHVTKDDPICAPEDGRGVVKRVNYSDIFGTVYEVVLDSGVAFWYTAAHVRKITNEGEKSNVER